MFHSTAQNLQDLADLLDLYTEYQVPEAVAPPYAGYDEYEGYPTKQYDGDSDLYSPSESEEEVYAPAKREMLSNMPGLKKRFFYPSYEEPETHWGPFVTQHKKRAEEESQEESYQKLLMLAQALAGDQPSSYYYDVSNSWSSCSHTNEFCLLLSFFQPKNPKLLTNNQGGSFHKVILFISTYIYSVYFSFFSTKNPQTTDKQPGGVVPQSDLSYN